MSPVPQGTLLILVQCVPRTDVLGYFHAVPSGLGGRVGYVKGAPKKVGIERRRRTPGAICTAAVQQKQPAFRLANRSSMESPNYILQQPGFPLIWTALIGYLFEISPEGDG